MVQHNILFIRTSTIYEIQAFDKKFGPSSNISDGDSDASVGGGQAPEDPDQDQEIQTASSGKLICSSIIYL